MSGVSLVACHFLHIINYLTAKFTLSIVDRISGFLSLSNIPFKFLTAYFNYLEGYFKMLVISPYFTWQAE